MTDTVIICFGALWGIAWILCEIRKRKHERKMDAYTSSIESNVRDLRYFMSEMRERQHNEDKLERHR